MARSAAQKRSISKRKGTYLGYGQLKAKLARRGVKNPGALAASIGRKKYGKKGMAQLAAVGRRHRSRR